MAFAAAVFRGHKSLADCPYLDRSVVERYGRAVSRPTSVEEDMQSNIGSLQEKIRSIDLAAAADRVGARFNHNKLALEILGKPFRVDTGGNMSSDIHVHPWIAIPVLSYILESKGLPLTGKWVPLRELKGGKDWHPLYMQRCIKPMQRVADTYPDLFEDMIHLFNGKQVADHYESDISVVLYPLPKVPMLICYWKPEDGLESDLNIFFDKSADANLGIESIYSLVAGLVRMFEKLSVRHGY
jgi:hypothetical protein